MYYGWRAPALRLTALSALVVSAALTADRLHPGRSFCPLAEACDKARTSALGSIRGVPTSVIGMLAFGGLFVLTLLPVELGRKMLRPAGILAAAAGAGLFLYQATVLHSFCPLCLVADAAGLIAGAIVLTWPTPPVRRSGKRLPGERMEHRLRWTAIAVAAVALPFAWPRPEKPGWTAIQEPVALVDADPAEAPPEPPPAPTPAPSPAAPAAPAPPAPARDVPWAPPRPSALPYMGPDLATTAPSRPEAPAAVERPLSVTPAPAPSTPPPPPKPPPPPPPPQVIVVEYLNAFCAHCRATNARFERVMAESRVTARVRRVYVWSSSEPPLWARVCTAARAQGLEDRVFAELTRAGRETAPEIWDAAQRAGADLDALRAALDAPDTRERLARHRQISSGAGLAGLPTLDIGRRRLMGEQSEWELKDAVDAALALSAGRR